MNGVIIAGIDRQSAQRKSYECVRARAKTKRDKTNRCKHEQQQKTKIAEPRH